MGDDAVIIKKIKKGGGHGHHGGAWKIAYADFVTAMMAFFLLMWLLAMASKDTLQGIADYFAPSQGIVGESGSILKFDSAGEASEDADKGGKVIVFGANAEGGGGEGKGEGLSEEQLKSLGSDIKDSIEKDEELGKYKDNIILEMTSDGLLIQIVSSRENPPLRLFEYGYAEPTDQFSSILKHIIKMIYYVPNYISIVGHTTGAPVLHKESDYSNWELSADRANGTRRRIVELGLDKDQIVRIIGKSSVEPLDPAKPNDISNSRIGITILRPEVYMPSDKQNEPTDFFDQIDKS